VAQVNPTSLYDILACPICRVRLVRQADTLVCTKCQQGYPVINNVPVIFPQGGVPCVQHESELLTRSTYNPWVNRVILQSLLDNQIVLEVGSGTMILDDPCIIRMDVTLTPYVDLVADVHALPFLPESIDYIFSLAVVEHLRNPFLAAQSMYEVLKDGGYIYHECNFVFAYHGYPHHYFNASMQGMEQLFSQYVPLRKGVAPYQMPSFAVDSVIRNYLRYSQARYYTHGRRLVALLENLLKKDLMSYDIYFTEEAALNVAAGTYFCGMKQTTHHSTLIPAAIRKVWGEHPELQKRFPNINDLTTVDNILVWAKNEGRKAFPEIECYLDSIVRFNKRGPSYPWDRSTIVSMPLVEPKFGAIGYDPDVPLEVQAQIADERECPPTRLSLFRRAIVTLQCTGLKRFLRQVLQYIGRRMTR
jgi:uncharacterized protein YbaR (Trm112 family)/SAM-dependent methyltransferase